MAYPKTSPPSRRSNMFDRRNDPQTRPTSAASRTKPRACIWTSMFPALWSVRCVCQCQTYDSASQCATGFVKDSSGVRQCHQLIKISRSIYRDLPKCQSQSCLNRLSNPDGLVCTDVAQMERKVYVLIEMARPLLGWFRPHLLVCFIPKWFDPVRWFGPL
jgi:hypothetical protein